MQTAVDELTTKARAAKEAAREVARLTGQVKDRALLLGARTLLDSHQRTPAPKRVRKDAPAAYREYDCTPIRPAPTPMTNPPNAVNEMARLCRLTARPRIFGGETNCISAPSVRS